MTIRNRIRTRLIFSSVVSLALILSFATTACTTSNETIDSKATTVENEPTTQEASTSAQSASETQANAVPEANDENVVVWKIQADYGSQDFIDKYIDIWQAPLNDLLKEKGAAYTVRIESWVPESEVERSLDQLKQWKNQGTQVDVMSTEPRRVDDAVTPYASYVKENLFLPLDDYLDSEKGRLLKASMHEKDFALSSVDGVVYGLGTVIPSRSVYAYDAKTIETMALDKANINSDFLENEKLFKQIKTEVNRAPLFMPAVYWVSSNVWIESPGQVLALDQNGLFVNVFESESFNKRIKTLYKWKEEGLISTETSIEDALIFQNPKEAFLDRAYEIELSLDIGSTEKIKKTVYLVPDLSQPVMALYRGDVRTGISSWTNNKGNAEDFLQKLFTDPDIANLIQYGIEGEDYKKLDDNRVERIGLSGLENFSYRYTNNLITYSTAEMSEAKRVYQDTFFSMHALDFPFGFRFDGTKVMDEMRKCKEILTLIPTSDKKNARMMKIITLDSEDMDKDIKLLVAELKEAGVDKVIEEANVQLAEWKKSNP